MTAGRQREAVSAWLLDGRGGGRLLSGDALERWRPADGPLWLDLDQESESDRAWLAGPGGLTESDRALFLQKSAWPRVLVPGPEQLLLLMRVPAPAARGRPDRFLFLRMWIEPHRAISMCASELPELRDVRARLEAGWGPTTVDELVLVTTEFTAARLADGVLELRPALADLEVALERGDTLPADELRRLRRDAAVLLRYIDPQRDLLLRLRSLDLPWIMKSHGHRWRAVIDYIDEGSRELTSVIERAGGLHETIAHHTTEQISRRIYLLTLVSTLLLPLSVVVGLFGVNLSTRGGNILGGGGPLWFLGLCAVLALLAGLMYALFRRSGLL